MDGCSKNKAVIVPGQLQEIVHCIVKDATVFLDAGFTGDAAGEGLVADLEHIRVNPALIQLIPDFGQGGIGAALFMGTAIDQ